MLGLLDFQVLRNRVEKHFHFGRFRRLIDFPRFRLYAVRAGIVAVRRHFYDRNNGISRSRNQRFALMEFLAHNWWQSVVDRKLKMWEPIAFGQHKNIGNNLQLK
jgi:hypothetical protein